MSVSDVYKKALGEAIEIWEDRAKGELRVGKCPLCVVSNLEDERICGTCPVFKETGQENCEGTPYMEWSRKSFESKASTEAAKQEVAFLKGLR